MPTDDLEKRLSTLSLRHPTDTYSARAGQIIRAQTRSGKPHAVYLNYALALSLLLSLGANFLLLTDYRQEMRQLSVQCDINPTEAFRDAEDPDTRGQYATLNVSTPQALQPEPLHYC